MQLDGIDHYNLRTTAREAEALRDFYRDVLGLREGRRPAFSFPGYWMYLGDAPVLHIAGALPEETPEAAGTGRFDHISFRARDAKGVQKELDARGIAWRGTGVPGTEIYQLFFRDPAGVKVELTFYDGAG